MNKAELTAAIVKKTGFTKKDAEKAIAAVTDVITETLAAGEKVQIVGFGGFEVRSRPARVARNPRTGEQISIEASKAPVFKAGKALIASINPNPAFTTVVAGKANNGNGGNEPTGRDRIIENINREKN